MPDLTPDQQRRNLTAAIQDAIRVPADRAAEAVLVAHQAHRNASCLCGWSELGKSHPGHQVAKLREVGLLADEAAHQQPDASPDRDCVYLDVRDGQLTVTQTTGRTLALAVNGEFVTVPDRERTTIETQANEPAAGRCGLACSEGHTYMAGCAIKPPARAFIGERPCGNPDCPCGGS